MKHTRLLLLTFFLPLISTAQTPTLVQHVSCPNSRNFGAQQSNTPDYFCPLPEPTQAGNTIILAFQSTTGSGDSTFTVSDDKSNTWARVNSAPDGNNNAYIAVWVAQNVAAGTRTLKVHRNTYTYNFAASASEFYNVGAVDTSSCSLGSSSTSETAGSITPSAGDLIWQWAAVPGFGATSSFAAGSQSGITCELLGTDLWDGDASQYGIWNGTGSINPTLTSGTSLAFNSCAVAMKASAAGNAPSAAFRVVHMLHQQHPQGAANPWPMQFPSLGNLIVVSYGGGGSQITGITSSPSNSWTSTGAFVGSQATTTGSQIYYAANATTANNLTMSVTRSDTVEDGTLMTYDVVGAAASPFDKDSGGQTGDQTTEVSSLTTCSNCLTPSTAHELVIANAVWDWCTATASSSPSGSLFDAATDTGGSIDGPQPTDQNNGWLHFYAPNANTVTVTWTMACRQPEGPWAGRVAAFKPAGSVAQQPAPPTLLKAVVN